MLIKFFQKTGFEFTNINSCIFAYQQDNIFIIGGIYVDDFAFVS